MTDGRTDGQTDGRTDGPTKRGVESRSILIYIEKSRMTAILSLCIKLFGNAISLKLIKYFEKSPKRWDSYPSIFEIFSKFTKK